jgi:hypothetical protein
MIFNSVGSIDGDFVFCFVAVLDAEIVVVEFDVNKWQN